MTKADVIESVDEIVDALAKYAERRGEDVELTVCSDGTASLMGGEAGDGFAQIEAFDSFSDLWVFLRLAEA